MSFTSEQINLWWELGRPKSPHHPLTTTTTYVRPTFQQSLLILSKSLPPPGHRSTGGTINIRLASSEPRFPIGGQLGKKGVWIKMPIELVNLVEPAVKEGFYYHHAESRYVMLVHWLPSTANTLPANASHRVGIVAFVMNEKNEVLVVQEKVGKSHETGMWKFPTGVVDEGEDICDAGRERSKRRDRQIHKSFFEKSDLIFVCMLQPLSFDLQPQEAEIEAAQWMPFEEYKAQPFVQKNEFPRYIADVCLAKKDREYSGFSPIPMASKFPQTKSYLYLNRQGLGF
ncbi:Nudix hydrolase 2 [Abeliophyllum distichum]|uniref:Nudix hydrolase 2 n=1 Tax=Abeliophyllum distichum TaxID=126358 RepID=A0ABD1UGH8_9LAMI